MLDARLRHLIILAASSLFVVILLGGCDVENITPPAGEGSLEQLSVVDISGVPEPSGLALDIDGSHFWTVSDQTGDVYRINSSGQVVATIDFNGEDLEGIAIDPLDGSIFIVEERAGEVIHLSRTGQVLERWTPAGLPSMGNSGLEGITIDPLTGSIFLLKEKGPGLLVKINRNGAVISVNELAFASDYSGLAYDAGKNQLMVISDQSGTITWCDFEGHAIRTLSEDLNKGEGITIHQTESKLFAVSDSDGTLTSYVIPDP